MKTKNIIAVLVLCTIVILVGLKAKKIKRYFADQRYYSTLVKYNILKKCYAPHPDIEEIVAQEGFDYFSYDKEVTSSSLKKLEDKTIKDKEVPSIPTISHRVYFSAQDSQNKLDDFYIEEMKLHFNNLNSLGDAWQHLIWTNQPNLFPAEVVNIKGVEIRSIDEFKNHLSYEYVIEALRKGGSSKPYLTEATDFIRLMVVQKFGGVYTDNDYEIYNLENFSSLIKRFDFIGARETIRLDSFYTNSFFSAKPDHPIINDILERRLRNYKLVDAPVYTKQPCNIYDRILFNGPVLMAISYFAKNNIDGNNDIIMPSWMMMNVDFSRYKNNNCKLSEITKDSFEQTSQNLDKIISSFVINPKLEEWQYTYNLESPFGNENIYYNLKNRAMFDIIGSDASCGTWIIKGNHQKFFYFNYPKNLQLFGLGN